MRKRGIITGVCICLVTGLFGCGRETSDIPDLSVNRVRHGAYAEADDQSARRETAGQKSVGKEDTEGKPEERASSGKRSERQGASEENASERKPVEKRSGDHGAPEKKSEEAASRYEQEHYREEASEDSGRRQTGIDNLFQVDCLTFELPDGWDVDEYMSNGYDTVFAPGGNAETAMSCLIVSEVTYADHVVELFLEDTEEMQREMEEILGGEEGKVSIEDAGMTFLGHTVRVEVQMLADEEPGVIVFYFAEDDKNLYILYALTLFEPGERIGNDIGLSEEMKDALAMFFETGEVDNRSV